MLAVSADHDVAAVQGSYDGRLPGTTLETCRLCATPNLLTTTGGTGTCEPAMLNQARSTWPARISATMVLWVNSLNGHS